MTSLRAVRHIGVCFILLILILGFPLLCTGSLDTLLNIGVDAISGATTVIDQPSGEYVLLINSDMHTDTEKLNDWLSFFSGNEIGVIFEDVSCSVPKGDNGALELARSFQSRLPENQMKLYTEDAILLCSQADNGLFDVMIFSKEYADIYSVESTLSDDIIILSLNGGGEADNK